MGKIDLKFDLKFNEEGLIPTIVQDINTHDVLMLAYMNEESLKKTIETGFAHYWSRSRKKLWKKGETSGNTQKVEEIYYDCDKDSLLLKVEQKGDACHTGNRTCFFKTLDLDNNIKTDFQISSKDASILYELYGVIEDRRENPIEGSYTNYLFSEGIDKILKKVGEEATEVVIASKNDSKEEVIYEVSDLIYHLTVLLVNQDITLDDIFEELKTRR
ncbi:MAG TPA: bifunctional phosphoribosyl-AMP cyclohydrolase/phosphoribosyl-ATP diphosphatase HisIE [Clostridiales bacterium]|nr:bifunctional phosphoribosyl-AMP cyclohydrolase/phosphoribosyl-ATP diphosphatase HisIE [Clostridiales bacterium]